MYVVGAEQVRACEMQVRAAKRTLLKALHICPHDQKLLFNAAYCMQTFASKVR